jgi:hypothetical protein
MEEPSVPTQVCCSCHAVRALPAGTAQPTYHQGWVCAAIGATCNPCRRCSKPLNEGANQGSARALPDAWGRGEALLQLEGALDMVAEEGDSLSVCRGCYDSFRRGLAKHKKEERTREREEQADEETPAKRHRGAQALSTS